MFPLCRHLCGVLEIRYTSAFVYTDDYSFYSAIFPLDTELASRYRLKKIKLSSVASAFSRQPEEIDTSTQVCSYSSI